MGGTIGQKQSSDLTVNTSGSKGPMFGQLCDLVKERGSI